MPNFNEVKEVAMTNIFPTLLWKIPDRDLQVRAEVLYKN